MVLHDSDGKNHCHKTHLLVATHPSHQTHSTEKQVSLYEFIIYNHVHLSSKSLSKKSQTILLFTTQCFISDTNKYLYLLTGHKRISGS